MRIGLTILFLIVVVFTSTLLITSCKKSNYDTSTAPSPLSFIVPDGFPKPVYSFNSNPITKEGFELGRKLFYDGKLSKDGNFPCASCHQAFAAFATYDHNLSHGFNNQFTTRNAPGLFNLAWQREFHFDGGINHLDLQPLAPITAPNEMAEDINNVVNKLKADKEYVNLFKAAFGTGEVNSQNMLRALSQFMLMLVSSNSKYDKVKRQEATFTIYEQAGYNVFKTKCASCHTEPLLTDLKYHNTGFRVDPYLKDYGRVKISQLKEDSLKFKTPSLRNIMLTSPYIHDGRFWSIDQVLDHYQSGITYSRTLDPSLLNGIKLSSTERRDIKAFLFSLSDTSFTKNKMFEQP